MAEIEVGWLETVCIESRRLFYHPLTRDSGLLATSQYVSAGLNLFTTIIAARLLGPGDYGLAALALSYPSLVWSFAGVKTVSVTIRYISGFRARGEHKELLSVVKLGFVLDFFVSVFSLLLVGVSAWWVCQHFYRIPELTLAMIVFAFSFPFYSLTGSSRAIFSSFQKFHTLSMFNVIGSFIKLVFVVTSILLGFGAAGMVVAIALEQIGTGIAMMTVATAFLNREGVGLWWKGSLANIRFLRRELTQFFGWNYIFMTLNGFVDQIPLMLLGRLRGTEEAGYYRLASNIVTVGSYIEGSLANIAYPIFSARFAAKNQESPAQLLRRWTWKGGLPLSILTVSVIPFLPWIIPIVFGDPYRMMVRGTQIMMGKAAISALFFWLNAYYYASGKVGFWVKSFAVYSVLMVALGWVGISYGGFLGMILVNVLLSVMFKGIMAMLAFRAK